jgi:hypothetical protein
MGPRWATGGSSPPRSSSAGHGPRSSRGGYGPHPAEQAWPSRTAPPGTVRAAQPRSPVAVVLGSEYRARCPAHPLFQRARQRDLADAAGSAACATDLALDHTMIPLGSSTVALNAAAEIAASAGLGRCPRPTRHRCQGEPSGGAHRARSARPGSGPVRAAGRPGCAPDIRCG